MGFWGNYCPGSMLHKASLVYRGSSRIAKATQRNLVLRGDKKMKLLKSYLTTHLQYLTTHLQWPNYKDDGCFPLYAGTIISSCVTHYEKQHTQSPLADRSLGQSLCLDDTAKLPSVSGPEPPGGQHPQLDAVPISVGVGFSASPLAGECRAAWKPSLML